MPSRVAEGVRDAFLNGRRAEDILAKAGERLLFNAFVVAINIAAGKLAGLEVFPERERAALVGNGGIFPAAENTACVIAVAPEDILGDAGPGGVASSVFDAATKKACAHFQLASAWERIIVHFRDDGAAHAASEGERRNEEPVTSQWEGGRGRRAYH